PARLLADPHAVGDFGRDGAADGAMRADAFAPLDLRPCRRRAGFRLAHAAEWQAAERREPAGGQPRTVQEGAPFDFVLFGDVERGALRRPRRPFRSLDQHGMSPQLGYRLTR